LLPVIFFWRRQRRATALFYLVGVGLLKLSLSLLKVLVGRHRPPEAMIELATLSMPSGHGANAVMIYGVLAIYLLQKVHAPLWRAVLFLLCFGLIIMTDLSRVYLGVHYPSDVLMGSLYAAAGLWLLQGLRQDLFLFNSQQP
jgi:undecaprenyl-diphosphatase